VSNTNTVLIKILPGGNLVQHMSMRIGWVTWFSQRYGQSKKRKNSLTSVANDQKVTIENQRLTWSLVRIQKTQRVTKQTTKKYTLKIPRLTWSLVRMYE
jgi:hypothetical protein